LSKYLRWIQWGGLFLMTLSAFGTTFHYRAYPTAAVQVARAEAQPRVAFRVMGEPEVPARILGTAIASAVKGPDHFGPVWQNRRWYPYLLLPLWIVALLLISGKAGVAGTRRRRLVGEGMWLLALVIAVWEAAYLRSEYAPFLKGFLGSLEVFLTWCVVVAMIFYRRKADRHMGAVEAAVAAQGLLAFAHAMTLPSTMARGWLPAFDTATVVETVLINYPPLFWIGCAGTLMIALPVYLRKTSA